MYNDWPTQIVCTVVMYFCIYCGDIIIVLFFAHIVSVNNKHEKTLVFEGFTISKNCV